MAITGKSFCKSAEHAFFLISRNTLRFGVLHGLGWLFGVAGQLFIMAFTVSVGVFLLFYTDEIGGDYFELASPLILICIVSYVTSGVFIHVYEKAADAIMHCFLVDEETQNKVNRTSKHCPDRLKAFLDKKRESIQNPV